MLKLMPMLNEENKSLVEGTIPYDIVLNQEKIGTFTLYYQQKENNEDLCGWADQYDGDYYWGDKDCLLRFVLSTPIIKTKAPSFILISNLNWEISDKELFKRDSKGECIVDHFILQLEELRIEYHVELSFIASTYEVVHTPEWEFILKELGFKPISRTDLETFYTSSRHLCEECLTAWTPIEETICLGCHQEKYHANICD